MVIPYIKSCALNEVGTFPDLPVALFTFCIFLHLLTVGALNIHGFIVYPHPVSWVIDFSTDDIKHVLVKHSFLVHTSSHPDVIIIILNAYPVGIVVKYNVCNSTYFNITTDFHTIFIVLYLI